MSQVQVQTQTPAGGVNPAEEKTFLVWQKDTWGSFGQHHNIYTFVVDIEKKQLVPIFQLVTVKHVNNDSRKNIHRYTYVAQSEMKRLTGRVLKQVHDIASSRKREVTVKYYVVREDGDLKELNYETGLKDAKGWFDKVCLPDGRVIIVRKDEVEVQ
jgi:hypothetical protein